MILTWFRFHAVVLNDPGRLIAVQIMHTSPFICGWLGSIAVFNTMWRQDQLMLPVMDQLGVSSSWGTWKVEGAYFLIGDSHSCLSGCLFAAAIWSLDRFYDRHTGQSAIDASKLLLSRLALSGLSTWYLWSYPGIWLITAYDITGCVLLLEPTGGIEGLAIATHYIAYGIVALVVRILHMCVRLSLGLCLYRTIGTVLARSTALVALLVAGTMWYGSATTPAFFGPTRYQLCIVRLLHADGMQRWGMEHTSAPASFL
jgi:photosystem II CP47 chlorophyll apoprotein